MIPERHEVNVTLGLLKRPEWKPVLPDFIPVPFGIKWNCESRTLSDPEFKPKPWSGGLAGFLNEARTFFETFGGQRIGVQLSGGLDSSLIIGLLEYLGIEYGLVGMTTERFEFRTERHVQSLLAEKAKDAVLIDYDNALPLRDIEQVPRHQSPDLSCINFSADEAMARSCQERGIRVLLTGMGGDVVLGNAVPADPEALGWRPQVFNLEWAADVVYATKGVRLIPFFGQDGILNAIHHFRLGQPEDIPKNWARRFFRKLLPRELVDYNYCADFWGIYVDGLHAAIPDIRQLHAKAAQLSGHPYFSKEALEALLSQDLLECSKSLYQRIEARVSMAVWVHSLLSGKHGDTSQSSFPHHTENGSNQG